MTNSEISLTFSLEKIRVKIIIDVSAPSLSSQIELNDHCRKMGALYLSVYAAGLFGALFVDAGRTQCQLPTTSHSHAQSTICSIKPTNDEGFYNIEAVPPINDSYIGISSLLSGNFSTNNLRLGSAIGKSKDELMIEIAASSHSTSTTRKLQHIVESYFNRLENRTEKNIFENLIFKLTKNAQDGYLLEDNSGILKEKSIYAATCFGIASDSIRHHHPLRSYEWICSDCLISDHLVNSLLQEDVINCQGFADSFLATYLVFLCSALRYDFHLHSTKMDSMYGIDEDLLRRLYSTSSTLFAPTISFIASMTVQEIISFALGSAGSPSQWLLFDIPELGGYLTSTPSDSCCPAPDSLLTFPPSKFLGLAHGSITFFGSGVLAVEMVKNLLQSGVSSLATITIVPPTHQIQSMQQILELERSLCSHVPKHFLPRVVVRSTPSDSPISYFYPQSQDWEADVLVADMNEAITAVHHHSLCKISSHLHYPPMVTVSSHHHLPSVETFIPGVSAPLQTCTPKRQTPVHFVTTMSNLLQWAHGHEELLTTSTHKIKWLLRAHSLGDPLLGPQIQTLVQWLRFPCTTLRECVEWALDWYCSNFVHQPSARMACTRLIGVSALSAEPFHRYTSPPVHCLSSKMPLNSDEDPYTSNLIVIISIIAGLQSGVLPFSFENFQHEINHYYASKRTLILDIARELPTPSFEDFASRDAQNPKAFVDEALKAPKVTQRLLKLKIIPFKPFLAAFDVLGLDFMESLVQLRSRMLGTGVIPKDQISRHLFLLNHHPSSPVAVVASSALSAVEVIKCLLKGNPKFAPHQLIRNHYLNMRSTKLLSCELLPQKTVNLAGKTLSEWEAIFFYASNSTTLGSLLETMEQSYNLNINLIAVQSSLLWCQSFSAHSSRLDLSLRELLTISSASVGNGDLRTYRLIVSGDDLNGNEYDPELIIYFIEP